MGTVRLQYFGTFKGTPVKDVKIGDTLVWNHGYTSTVMGLQPSKTGKTIVLQLLDRKGDIWDRKMGANRLVVVA